MSSTVRLREGDLGFCGRVVDATNGTGIAGARVEVFEHWEDVRAPEELAEASLSTDLDGRFSVVGAVDGRRHVVTVSAVGYATEEWWCATGADPCEFRLWPAGTVRGVLQPPCLPAGATLAFWEAGDAASGWSERGGELDADGRFVSEALPSGTWIIGLRENGVAMGSFRVMPGRELDLGVVRVPQPVVCLGVVDMQGQTPPEAWARVVDASGTDVWIEANEGRVGLEVASGYGLIEVFAPGHDLVRVGAASGQRVVAVVVPHEPLLLRLSNDLATPAQPVRLAVRLIPRFVAGSLPQDVGEIRELASTRATRLWHCGAGAYDLEWLVHDGKPDWRFVGRAPFAVPHAGGIVEVQPSGSAAEAR